VEASCATKLEWPFVPVVGVLPDRACPGHRGGRAKKAPVLQGNVVDLMDALRRSLKADKSGAEKPSQTGKRVAKGDKRQQGLPLPIKGDRVGKAEPPATANRRWA
jgi:hypothetical protein